MKITRKSSNGVLLSLFMIICIFFPGDPFNIKELLLLILLIINARCIFNKIGTGSYRVVLVFGLIFPIIIMLHSMLLTGNIGGAISSAYSPVILLLLIPSIEQNLYYKDKLITFLKLVSLATLMIAFLDIIGVINVNGSNFIRNSFYSYGMGIMGKSAAYSSYYRIFFKTSPLLVVLLDDSITKKDIKWVILAFGALFFSGTRANVFSALIIFFVRYVFWSERKGTSRYIIAFIILAVVLFNLPRISNMILGAMNTSGAMGSDLVRSGEFRGYVEVFSNPVKLIFGSGFGSTFFNYGRDSMDYTSELSYFELIRCLGLIFAVPYFLFVLWPVFSRRVKADYKLSYICYLIIAATNPLLFSSTAMLMYMFMYEDIIRASSSRLSVADIDTKLHKRIVFRIDK